MIFQRVIKPTRADRHIAFGNQPCLTIAIAAVEALAIRVSGVGSLGVNRAPAGIPRDARQLCRINNLIRIKLGGIENRRRLIAIAPLFVAESVRCEMQKTIKLARVTRELSWRGVRPVCFHDLLQCDRRRPAVGAGAEEVFGMHIAGPTGIPSQAHVEAVEKEKGLLARNQFPVVLCRDEVIGRNR